MSQGEKIAIIGAGGKMGRWFARLLLNERFEIIVADKDEARLIELAQTPGLRATPSNSQAVEEAGVLLLSVPIDQFGDLVAEIGPQVRPDQIVFDVTSIKALPVDLMHRTFNTSQILGTHPVFGPGAKDLNSQNFVLTPTNAIEMELAQRAQDFLETRGARVSVMSPAEHDRIMAVVLGLAHFVSITAADTLAGLGDLSSMKSVGGSTYRVLTTLVESVISEDPELYATLQMNLPGLADIERLFLENAAKWAGYVQAGDKPGFKQSMVALKEKFEQSNPNFGRAYENMYKIMEWL